MSIVGRAITAAGYATGASRGGHVSQLKPNIFAGTAALCDDMRVQLDAANMKCVELRAARAVGDVARMTAAATDLAATVATLSRMNESLGQVLQWHAELSRADAVTPDKGI